MNQPTHYKSNIHFHMAYEPDEIKCLDFVPIFRNPCSYDGFLKTHFFAIIMAQHSLFCSPIRHPVRPDATLFHFPRKHLLWHQFLLCTFPL